MNIALILDADYMLGPNLNCLYTQGLDMQHSSNMSTDAALSMLSTLLIFLSFLQFDFSQGGIGDPRHPTCPAHLNALTFNWNTSQGVKGQGCCIISW